jgi:hypothetical protein
MKNVDLKSSLSRVYTDKALRERLYGSKQDVAHEPGD